MCQSRVRATNKRPQILPRARVLVRCNRHAHRVTQSTCHYLCEPPASHQHRHCRCLGHLGVIWLQITEHSQEKGKDRRHPKSRHISVPSPCAPKHLCSIVTVQRDRFSVSRHSVYFILPSMGTSSDKTLKFWQVSLIPPTRYISLRTVMIAIDTNSPCRPKVR